MERVPQRGRRKSREASGDVGLALVLRQDGGVRKKRSSSGCRFEEGIVRRDEKLRKVPGFWLGQWGEWWLFLL